MERSKVDMEVGLLQTSDLKVFQTGQGTCIRRCLNEYPNSMGTTNVASTVKFSVVRLGTEPVTDIDKKWGRRDLF